MIWQLKICKWHATLTDIVPDSEFVKESAAFALVGNDHLEAVFLLGGVEALKPFLIKAALQDIEDFT